VENPFSIINNFHYKVHCNVCVPTTKQLFLIQTFRYTQPQCQPIDTPVTYSIQVYMIRNTLNNNTTIALQISLQLIQPIAASTKLDISPGNKGYTRHTHNTSMTRVYLAGVRHRLTTARRCLFSRAAATLSLSPNCLFTEIPQTDLFTYNTQHKK